MPLDLLKNQAEAIGKRLSTADTIYRLDKRTPEEIRTAGGMKPNPEKPSMDLAEHTNPRSQGGGNLVSTTTVAGNKSNIQSPFFEGRRISGPTEAQAKDWEAGLIKDPNEVLPEVKQNFEYEAKNVEGVDMSTQSRWETEFEFTTNQIQTNQIHRYREVTVTTKPEVYIDPQTGQPKNGWSHPPTVEFGPWRDFNTGEILP